MTAQWNEGGPVLDEVGWFLLSTLIIRVGMRVGMRALNAYLSPRVTR